MDFVTHYPSVSSKTTIIVVVYRLSKQANFSTLGSQFIASQMAEVLKHDLVRLHNILATSVFDRDLVFMSLFWCELFLLHETLLAMSSAYHMKFDKQTKIINHYLEDYRYYFTGNHSQHWVYFLPWV